MENKKMYEIKIKTGYVIAGALILTGITLFAGIQVGRLEQALVEDIKQLGTESVKIERMSYELEEDLEKY